MKKAPSALIFRNTTTLDDAILLKTFVTAARPWPTEGLDIRVRYSRGSDFSGTCHYTKNRIYANLGKHLRYPYLMDTYLARAVSSPQAWWKPLYSIELADGYQVVLFVLFHEFYHWLIKRAHRNTRQKESMCDRFAARILVDVCGAKIRDPQGRLIRREVWDFQDLDRFVARAMTNRGVGRPRPAVVPQQPTASVPGPQLSMTAHE